MSLILALALAGEPEFERGIAAEGLDTPSGYAAARGHFRAAIAEGYVGALTELAELLEDGRGGPKDQDGAITLYERAGREGWPQAMDALVRIYGERHQPDKVLEWSDRLLAQDDDEVLDKLVAVFKATPGLALPPGFQDHLAASPDRTGRKEYIEGLLGRKLERFKASARKGYAPAFAALGDLASLAGQDQQAIDFYRNGASRQDWDCRVGLAWLVARGRLPAGEAGTVGGVEGPGFERTARGDEVALYLARREILDGSFNALQAALMLLRPRTELPEARRLLDGFLYVGEADIRYVPGGYAALRSRAERGDVLAQVEIAHEVARLSTPLGPNAAHDEQVAWLRRAAAAGYAPAQLQLARDLEQFQVPGDEAATWLRRAAGEGYAEAQLDLARRLAAVDPAQAFRWAQEADRLGQLEARAFVAHAYLHGLGVAADPEAAARAAVGSAAATKEVALAFDEGKLAPRDPARAFRLMQQAAVDLGDASAKAVLAGWLESGHGTSPDPRAAITMLRGSLPDQDPVRQLHLAELYGKARDQAHATFWRASALAETSTAYRLGFGPPPKGPDGSNAAALYLAAGRLYLAGAFAGDDDVSPFGILNALEDLEKTHPIEVLEGYFVRARIDELDRDADLAAKHYAAAADLLLARRTEHLAPLVAGVPARAWLAAAAGFELAWVYANGTGVPRNDARAIALVRPAARRGELAARLLLARLLVRNPATREEGLAIFRRIMPAVMAARDPRTLVEVPRHLTVLPGQPVPDRGQADLRQATAALAFDARMAAFRRAAAAGSREAMATLADLADHAWALPRDPVERLMWLTIAHAHGGDPEALRWAEQDGPYRNVAATQARAAAWWAEHRR